MPESADVSIQIYNIVGQKITTLLNENIEAGFHQTTFEADNLASGVYIARLTAKGSSGEQFVSEIKMQLIK
ncbi:MAG: T9SS type A sorting domain-containing protein [Balneola sp.]